MLRNRPRTVPSSNKQALIADHHSPGPQAPNTRPISSFLISPRFRAFSPKGLSETDSLMTPNSTLDSTQFLFPNSNPKPFLLIDKAQTQKAPKSPESEPRGIGLALIDTFGEDPVGKNCSKPRNNNILFGSKLSVRIPQSSVFALTKNTQASPPSDPHPDSLTWKEMELSEDYTCVTSHGPNPRTTHIFGNCVVESYFVSPEKPKSFSPDKNKLISFLSFCHTCSKSLEQKNDIFIYRGDKAFCSEDCRNREMLLDDVVEN